MHDCATMKHVRPVKPNVPDVPASGVEQPSPLRRMRSRSIRRWPALICSVTRADRIAAIRTRWIRYARAEQIGARLDELLTLPKNASDAKPAHRGRNQQRQGRPRQAFRASTSAATYGAAHDLAHPGHSRASAAGPRRAALLSGHPRTGLRTVSTVIHYCPAPGSGASLLATGNVKMLIIDEIHHVRAGPTLRQRSFLNVIKFLGNELHIPIVVAGTHDAFNTIQTDPQLANRFEPAPLPRWTMNEDYLRLLASFEVGLGLEQASHFIEPASATKILALSGATIGKISALLSRAAMVAIERGVERITSDVLDSCGYVSPSEHRRIAVTM